MTYLGKPKYARLGYFCGVIDNYLAFDEQYTNGIFDTIFPYLELYSIIDLANARVHKILIMV